MLSGWAGWLLWGAGLVMQQLKKIKSVYLQPPPTKDLSLTYFRILPDGLTPELTPKLPVCWSSTAKSENASYFEVCYVDPNSCVPTLASWLMT